MFLLKELDELYNQFSDKAYEPKILDGKTKELIALACSIIVVVSLVLSIIIKKRLNMESRR